MIVRMACVKEKGSSRISACRTTAQNEPEDKASLALSGCPRSGPRKILIRGGLNRYWDTGWKTNQLMCLLVRSMSIIDGHVGVSSVSQEWVGEMGQNVPSEGLISLSTCASIVYRLSYLPHNNENVVRPPETINASCSNMILLQSS